MNNSFTLFILLRRRQEVLRVAVALVFILLSFPVFAQTGPITGTRTVCVGAVTVLTDATTGGTWNSASTGIATVGSLSGTVNGIAAGTAVISYTASGSTVTAIVTVNATPTVTLGPNPSVGTGVIKGFMSFSVTGTPTTYSLAYSSAAHSAGFTDVSSVTIPASPLFLPLTIPASVATATYAGTVTVTTAAGCMSAVAPMSVTATATGTWQTLTNFAPDYNEGVMILMTDGTVLTKTSTGSGYGKTWDKLTPVNGSYKNGTWSTIDTMTKDRLYFSSQVLPDGRLYVCGGEYGTGGKYGEVYNPKTNTWTATGNATLGNPFPNVVSDANSELLYTGKVLQASVDESGVNLNYLWDPVANTYSATASCLRIDNEAVWVKLPDSSVLFLDNYSTSSERYIPKTGTWVNDGTSPVDLYDPYGSEAGAGYMLPDGRAFFIGSTPKTAYYTPSGTTSPGTWAAGPAIPLNLGAADAASAMMPNGKILVVISPTPTSANHFPGPAYYFEFDYTTNTFTEITAPGGGDTTSNPCFISNTLDLPDGNVLFVNQGYDEYFEYVPVNAPLSAGQPTISGITRTNCDSFSITGTLFNGITEGAAYGDDWQMSTNYPIVRLASGSNVYYATTNNWNRIGAVSTGTLADTATFALPAGLPVGTYSVVVVVNGNPSVPFMLNTSLAISPATAQVCTGSNITLTDAATTGIWTSSNPAVGTIGSASGTVTGIAAGTTTISYSINQCYSTATITVNALPTATTSQTNVSCFGGSNGTATVTPSGGASPYAYVWSPSGGTASTASGLSSATYSCVITDAHTCSITKTVTITQPSQPLSTTTSQTNVSCFGGNNATASVTASGGTPFYSYAWSPAGGIASSASGLSAISYSCTITDANNCTLTKTFTITQPSVLTATTSQTNVSCNVGSNGTASVTASGGAGSYTYAWSPAGGTASSATGLSAISYTCTITDANSCSIAKTFTITQPSALTATTAQTNVNCNGGNNGTASVIASGGVGTYSYAWSPTGGMASSATGLSAISYTCTITDANICTLAKTFTITQPSALAATTTQTNVSCYSSNNGTASVTASGGAGSYSYTWSPAGGTASFASGLSAISYTCTITDANSCSLAETFTITQPTALTLTLGSDPVVSYGTPTVSITYTVTLGSPTTYTIAYDGPAHSAGFTDVTTPTALSGSPLTLSIPAASAGNYNGVLTVSDGTCSSSGNAFTINVVGVGNTPPSFTGGSPQALNVCENSGEANISSLLTVSDPDAGQTETWTIITPPVNGTLSGFATSAGSGSTSITPSGLTYIPSTGFSGTDAFTIQVSDGLATATTTINITVNPLPAAISGMNTLCVSTAATLSDAVTGGIWTSSASTTVSVNATGSINAVTAGTATISYSTGCGTTATLTVTVVPTPANINGASSVCTGASITLTDNIGGGAWSSANPSTESVDPVTGTVSGLASGTTTISYSTGCGTPATYTVTAVPPAAPISGATYVCQGSTTQMSDAVPGGTWTSTNPVIGTVDNTGMVTVTGSGSLGLSYYDGCGVPMTVTLNAIPITLSITRSNTVCAGGLDTLADAAPGGTWSGSLPGIGTIDPVSGIITAGTSGGTLTISYSTGCGTPATYGVTVNPLPVAGAITGSGTVCAGSSISLTDVAAGGIWSSNTPSVATIGSSGVVTGIATGTTVISYTVTNGCGIAKATAIITVNSVSAGTISGPTSVNAGSNITLSDPTGGGTWSAGNSNATVSSGLVTGVTAGTVIISYSVMNSCGTSVATQIVTVSASSVAAITGTANVCIGLTTPLTDVTSGGAWSSSNVLIATVATSGIVTGVAAGTATISYTLTGISSTIVITVSANPSGIGGASSVCIGSSVSVSDFTPGGAWSSSAGISVTATGSTTALVTGVTAGTALITYSIAAGCYRTYSIMVNAVPAPILGAPTLCTGAVSFVSDATSGGVSWTSSNTGVATISFSGGITAIAAGTTTITYLISNSCIATAVITVSAIPSAITGNAPVCQGATLGLADATGGGTWTSNNTDVAGVASSSGLVTGISSGTAMITYSTGGSGCNVTTVVTVSAAPNSGAITGASTVCTGSSVPLSDIATGGVWSSGAAGVATVTATGVVTGISSGTAAISYTVTNGCGSLSAILTVTISPAGSAGTILGTATVCVGATTSLTDLTTGGNWGSGMASVASVGSMGVVTGVTTGTAVISYTVPGGCGTAPATMVVTVTGVSAGTILGTFTVYTGSSVALSDVIIGGIWSASNSNATVSGGLVTGVSAGTVIISYSVTNSCGTALATAVVTVNPSSVAPITGFANACVGLTTALTDATPGGTWHSSNVLIATVNTAGVVTGAAVGTATISYTIAGIPATFVVTINANPSGIGGATSVCIGSSISVSDFTAGGTWSCTSNASVVSTGTASGLVTGISAGSATITYSLGSGCFKTLGITVNAVPMPISGTLTVCAGAKTFVSDATTPGVSWTSGTTSVATISASGAVTALTAGTTIITYTAGTGCKATAVVTVNPLPVVAAIYGASTLSHAGPPITLSDVTAGGVWSSTAPTVATVGSASGIVTAVASAGNTTISYTVNLLGCVAAATKMVTAGPSPHAHSSLGGTTIVTVGAAVSLADEIDGGVWGSSNNAVATVDDRGLVMGIGAGVAKITHTANSSDGEQYVTTTGVLVNSAANDIHILPNPNNGTFTVKGKLSVITGEEVSLKITDMLGQEIYKQVITTQDGLINQQIKLGNTLAKGMYILNIKSGNENSSFHFVIEK